MSDRTGRSQRPVVLAGVALVLVAAVLSLVLLRSEGDEERGDPVVAAVPTTRPVPTTSLAPLPETSSSTTTAPPTTAAPPEPADDSNAVALEFLVAVADEEVARECRASEYIVRRDHPGAELRVGLVGDSLTVQTVDQLTADARFDWTVVSVCGARVDHFAGGALFESSYDLTAGLDAMLADAPDMVVFALGTNDALKETYENRAVEHPPSLVGILDRTAAIRCRAWVDVHTVSLGAGGPYERWAYFAERFNGALRAHVESAGVPLWGWSGAVAANDPQRMLNPDGVHLSPSGRALRAQLIADALTGLANECVLAPPPAEVPAEAPPAPPPAPAPSPTTSS